MYSGLRQVTLFSVEVNGVMFQLTARVIVPFE